MGDSPTGNQYTNGEIEALYREEMDWHVYDDDDTYVACINRTHLAEGRDCALPSVREMATRITDMFNILGLLDDQLKAAALNPSSNLTTVQARLVRQYVRTARDQTKSAHQILVRTHPTNRGTR